MRRVRYVPGLKPSHFWTYAEVELPDDGNEPTHYWYQGTRRTFNTATLQELITSGRWRRDIDPDLEVDEGL